MENAINHHNLVVLVNEQDEMIGLCDKLEAHQRGLLHRAFSVFLYDIADNGELLILLQQRQITKYHCAGFWSNACCSHPAPYEPVKDAAIRRVREELGIILDAKQLQTAGNFCYFAKLDNELYEHEFDHVFYAKISHVTEFNNLNLDEVKQVQWYNLAEINQLIYSAQSMHSKPSMHNSQSIHITSTLVTPWFNEAIQLLLAQLTDFR